MPDALHFIACGSVDDGKSTLIGRLLFESKQVYADHLSALAKDSTRYGTQGDALDLALLVDGLQAEREQSITIDVSYRFFATPRRRFVVADTPGHEQYTRNMATGASNSDLAVLLVNAKNGLQTQTHRHARIVALLGIRHLVMAVNKMDLVQWDETVFRQIVEQFEPLVIALGFESFQPIPMSALHGDNITGTKSAASWYTGPSLLDWLESIEVGLSAPELGFRMPVQWVNRHKDNFRGYCGRIASGEVRVGERIRVLPSGTESKVRSIVGWKEERQAALCGESITICIEDEIDVSRGSVFAAAADALEVSDQFEANVLCLSENQLFTGRSYIFHLHSCQAVATITAIKYRIDVTLGTQLATRSLGLNDIGVIHLSLDRPVPFEPYHRCRRLGGFILIDRLDNQTVGAGMIDFALRRAANLHWQALAINKEARARQKLQKPVCLWFTGLPGSGKSTIANLLEKRLFAAGRHTYVLDGDNIRHGLNRDLGFSEADRVENIRRVTEVAKLLIDAGLIVIVAFISPYRAERESARSSFDSEEFLEIFVDASLEECERRDPKGLYAKARRGELVNFTGIDSKYEIPETPDIRLDTVAYNAEECVDQVLGVLDLSPLNFTARS
ncbi:adenylyl-sulfate kinase [Alloacidobacterium dinghuense]|uniref:Adenylyl-sulfate kinase n=1 Tax=Alloacidobacterium dinghuense TaxID=2763107 RepID=A0A7G8BKT2_9BACT|nr:adenylyl-sulfate kinase [Alloacidobacterium dinghuense]QNI33152.1 adenylyl-sulfate kinase [Alloacidobacterium dinghuense]